MNEKEFKNYIGNNIKSISSKISLEEINFLNSLVNAFNEVCMKYDKSQNNWNELKKWLEETIKQYDNVGLKFKKESNFECASRSYDYLKQYQTMLDKMQELEQGKDE